MMLTGLNVVFVKNNNYAEYHELMLKCGKIGYILR